jgi:hypothetical protein
MPPRLDNERQNRAQTALKHAEENQNTSKLACTASSESKSPQQDEEDPIEILNHLLAYLHDSPPPSHKANKVKKSTAILPYGIPSGATMASMSLDDILNIIGTPLPPPNFINGPLPPLPAPTGGLGSTFLMNDLMIPPGSAPLPPQQFPSLPPPPPGGMNISFSVSTPFPPLSSLSPSPLASNPFSMPPPPPPQFNFSPPPPPLQFQQQVQITNTSHYDSVFDFMSQQLEYDFGVDSQELSERLNDALDHYCVMFPGKSVDWKIWASERRVWKEYCKSYLLCCFLWLSCGYGGVAG